MSIDPKRVYVHSPEDAPCKCIEASVPGPNGEKYVWYQCTVSGGREARPIGAYEVAQAVEALGAGEILLNCIDKDGQGDGFELDLVRMVSDAVGIPVIASSGAGSPTHFTEVFRETNASAALAAGIFHRQEVSRTEVGYQRASGSSESHFSSCFKLSITPCRKGGGWGNGINFTKGCDVFVPYMLWMCCLQVSVRDVKDEMAKSGIDTRLL